MTIEIFSINFHLFELPFIVFLLGAAIWRLLQEGTAVQLSDAKPVRLFFVLLIVYIFLVQLSIVNAIAPIMVFKSVFKWLEVLLVTLLVFFYVSDQQKFKNIYWFLFWFNFSGLAYIYIQIIMGNKNILEYRLFSSFQFVLVYGMIFPIYLKTFKKALLILLLIITTAIMLSLSRLLYLSAFIVTIVSLWHFSHKRRQVAILFFPFITLLLFITIRYPEVFSRLFTFFSPKSGSNQERMTLFWLSLLAFSQHPFIGIGSLNFQDFYEKAGIPFGYSVENLFQLPNPHNTFLQIAAEEGVFALLVFSALVLLGFYLLNKHSKRRIISTDYMCGLQNFYLILFFTLFVGFISFQNRINLSVIWGIALALLRFSDQKIIANRETKDDA